MIYRCDLELAAYLSHAIAISDDITKNYDKVMRQSPDGKEPHDVETPPSDQRALCLVLEAVPEYASRFYHYPQGWLNSYDIPKDDGAGAPIQLHTHLVAGRKYRAEYNEYTLQWEKGWSRLISMTREESERRVIKVEQIAANWWTSARIGLPKCIWI